MSKKILLTMFGLLFFVLSAKTCFAACSNEELGKLKKEASKVKMVYEVQETEIPANAEAIAAGLTEPLIRHSFNIKMINVTNNMKVEITNDIDSTKHVFNYSNTDNGVYTFNWSKLNRVAKFTYKVYASSATNCLGEKLSTGYLTAPKYNTLSATQNCKDLPDYKYCKQYIDFDIDFTEQVKMIEEYKKKMEEIATEMKPTTLDKIVDFIEEHMVLLVTSTVLVVGGGAAFVIIRNNRKRVK